MLRAIGRGRLRHAARLSAQGSHDHSNRYYQSDQPANGKHVHILRLELYCGQSRKLTTVLPLKTGPGSADIMNRVNLIFGLIVVLSLLAPSMFCLMPGASMTFSEAECCRHMGPDCGDFLMPAHSCCKVTSPSGEQSLVRQAKRHIPDNDSAVNDSRIVIRLETPRSRIWNTFDRIPPLLLPLHSADILRI
jgi:hypothetical protein